MRHRLIAVALAVLAGIAAFMLATSGQPATLHASAAPLPTAPVAQTTEAPTTTARVATTQAPVASTVPSVTSMPVAATLPPLEGAESCFKQVGPDGVFIPKIGVCKPIAAKDLDLNGLNPYDDVVTRYLYSSLPGQGKVSFLTAHRDQPNGNHVFLRLEELSVGDDVVVWSQGQEFRYRIEANWGLVPKTQFGAWSSAYYAKIDSHELMLVTCGGEFDASTRHYVDNAVLTATLVA